MILAFAAPLLGLLAWLLGVTEWLLMQSMAAACRRIGVPVMTLRGTFTGGALPIDLERQVWGVRIREVSPGVSLIRPRLWWEPGPSADPVMPGFIGVLWSEGQQWFLQVRAATGILIFVAFCGVLASKELSIWSLAWVLVIGLAFAAAVSRARLVFSRIGSQIETARVELRVLCGPGRAPE
jgi:hypothetical protein